MPDLLDLESAISRLSTLVGLEIIPALNQTVLNNANAEARIEQLRTVGDGLIKAFFVEADKRIETLRRLSVSVGFDKE